MFGWIILAVVILIAVVSAVSQMVKSQEEANPRRRERPARPGGGVRTSSGDIDRFLQEIDRLRKKGADGGEAAGKARPIAKPARPAIPVVEPARRRVEPDVPRPVPTAYPGRVDELPMATVVPPAARPAREARPAPPTPAQPHTQTIAALGRVGGRPAQAVPKTEAGRQLMVLLKNPQSVPVAVLLQEILGTPKCKQ